MKSSDQEKLLRELLPDDGLTDFRQASLERGLASMRHHRRERVFLRAGTLAAVAAVLVLALLRHPHPPQTDIAAAPSPAPPPDHVKFISDDELLAMFPQGSVALVGKPGQQRLVLLDKTRAIVSGSEKLQ